MLQYSISQSQVFSTPPPPKSMLVHLTQSLSWEEGQGFD